MSPPTTQPIVSRDPCEPITDTQRDALRHAYPDTERLLAAIQLAPDHQTCVDLLNRLPVSRARLDPAALEAANQASLVTLTRPIDHLAAA